MTQVQALERDGMEAAVAKAWSHVRANLRRSAGQRLFDQWLKPVVLIEGSNAEIVRLGLPSAFMTQWVKNHYAERLLLEFRGQIPAVRSVSIETLAEEPKRVLSTASAPAAADSARFAPSSTAP